jgi:sec-independent protein translocase protein TatA
MPTPGPLELVIILVIALIILGPGKLPDVGASLGKSIREFRKASSDIQESVTVKVDTSPLPPQAPAAPETPAAVMPTSQAPIATAAPYNQPAPADVPDPHARIAELERQLAETRARSAESAPVTAASGSRESGTQASS